MGRFMNTGPLGERQKKLCTLLSAVAGYADLLRLLLLQQWPQHSSLWGGGEDHRIGIGSNHEMGMRKKCRVWWPKHLSLSEPSSSSLLFGWCISCSSVSLDVVVAFSCNEGLLSNCQSGLEGILQDVNQKMPVFLQDKSSFSLLGQCDAGFRDNGLKLEVVKEDNGGQLSTSGNALLRDNKEICTESNTRSCGCNKINGFVEKYRHASDGFSNWIQFVNHPCEQYCRDIQWIPELHHIHWNQQIVPQCDVHVVIYETPTYGVHHFLLGLRGSFQLVKAPLKKPKWVDELHQKQPLIDLDTAILAINSATAATVNFQRHVGSRRSFLQFSAVYKFLGFICQILAIFLASLSTLFYVALQFIHSSLSYASQSWLCITSLRMFRTTSINIQIRSRQILYWPVFLKENGIRSLSCVEYAEKAALHKHSVWSSLVVDILLGNLFGLALLYYSESDCSWVLNLANNITNNLLRSGCVWLMGVPAGFKLNTELAGVLGMISLNAIQIWSTLWIFAGFLFIYFIKGIAILGILFGMTVPAALIVDMITFATLHVSTLHWLISLLYSVQIQALAALWRLFRGRKWNPLRQRLDSYDYTVKQHVVGSLLFTLLLLLLPTTSVFYIFFTIMSSAISFICSLITSAISIIHATPYIKIFLWLVRRRRFPSGIWFEILSCRGAIDSSEVVCRDGGSVRESSSQKQKKSKKPTVLVSFLHSNFLSLGQTVSPHYRNVFCGVSGSFVATSAYGVLTGRRMACTLETGIPSKMPWMSIPCKEYWHLCYDAVLACCSSRQ